MGVVAPKSERNGPEPKMMAVRPDGLSISGRYKKVVHVLPGIGPVHMSDAKQHFTRFHSLPISPLFLATHSKHVGGARHPKAKPCEVPEFGR
mmetsp:Transcript_774/g.2043  ORF Transcript_774/g.2043 Transcript_774/m.2043 type:complete len:92 (+) Transcript_774:415-690(+)|eukprot:scaffold55524_cov41-Tisochrysis_lutea.AAC.2